MLSGAAAHPVPPATMSLGSATVHLASLGLAVSRVGAPPIPALWRGTTVGFPRVRPGLTLVDLYLACQPGTFGKDCEHLCQCPGETWACHPASGTCVCAAGYHGTDCQQRESGSGVLSAILVCMVEGGSPQGCHARGCCMFDSTSSLCSRPPSLPAGCPSGLYGPGCEHICKCLNGGTCDPATGACYCPAGFLGADCSLGEDPD